MCGRVCKERRGAVTALGALLAPARRAGIALMVTGRGFLAVDAHGGSRSLPHEKKHEDQGFRHVGHPCGGLLVFSPAKIFFSHLSRPTLFLR